jgi:Flp pilus assembly pilin Flp
MYQFITESRSLVIDEDGATALEHTVIAAVVALAVSGSVSDLGSVLDHLFIVLSCTFEYTILALTPPTRFIMAIVALVF